MKNFAAGLFAAVLSGGRDRSRTYGFHRVKANTCFYNLLISLINFNYIISYVGVFVVFVYLKINKKRYAEVFTNFTGKIVVYLVMSWNRGVFVKQRIKPP